MAVPQPLPTVDEIKPYILYPPFPKPPPGVAIVPFSQFQPVGIAVVNDPEVEEGEMDGLGIRTTPLRVRHDLTSAERKKGRKKKKFGRSTVVDNSGQMRKMLWHEEWDEREALASFSYDPHSIVFDRLYDAHVAFKEKRSWPPTTSPVCNLWEHIRVYIGFISSIQPAPKKIKNLPQVAIDEFGGDDDEDEYETSQPKNLGVDVTNDVISDQILAAEDGDQQGQADEAPLDLKSDLQEEKLEQRKQEFLYDTENTVKTFFSSHYRAKGLIWDKRRCEDGPILFAFWLRFLIRNNVFPEPEISRGLQRALTVCELARVELPATFVISKALEDGVSLGLLELFTKMTDGFDFGEWSFGEDNSGAGVATVSDEGEPDPKKRKVDASEAWGTGGDDKAEFIDADSMNVDTRALQDAIEDNVDVNGVDVKAAGSSWDNWGSGGPEWANGASGWGSDTAWGSGNLGIWEDTGSSGQDGVQNVDTSLAAKEQDKSADAAWLIPKPTTLIMLLGPTMLPLTHTTGVVERSTRRIVKIVPPSGPRVLSKSEKKKRGEAGAVEEELESRLGYMVLLPWVKVGDHVTSDVQPPVIQKQSRGPVVVISVDGSASNEIAPPADAFDPLEDEIQVLLEPASLDKLTLNMALTATWVQLARKDPTGDESEEEQAPTKNKKPQKVKKGGSGKNGQPTKWWYMEQFMAVLPSFHADRYSPDQA